MKNYTDSILNSKLLRLLTYVSLPALVANTSQVSHHFLARGGKSVFIKTLLVDENWQIGPRFMLSSYSAPAPKNDSPFLLSHLYLSFFSVQPAYANWPREGRSQIRRQQITSLTSSNKVLYIYTVPRVPECLSLVRIGTSPSTLPQASVSSYEPRGGHTRLRVRGVGSPNSDDWRKSLPLCLLCASSNICIPFTGKSQLPHLNFPEEQAYTVPV